MNTTTKLIVLTSIVLFSACFDSNSPPNSQTNVCGGTEPLTAERGDECQLDSYDGPHRASLYCSSGQLECRLDQVPGACQDWVSTATADEDAETTALCDACGVEMSCIDGFLEWEYPEGYGEACDDCGCGYLDCTDGELVCIADGCDWCQDRPAQCDSLFIPNVLETCEPVPACDGMSDLAARICESGSTCHDGACTAIEIEGIVGEPCDSNLECGHGLYCNLDYGLCTKHCSTDPDAYVFDYPTLNSYLDQVDPEFLSCTGDDLCVHAGGMPYNRAICARICQDDADCSDLAATSCRQAAEEDRSYCVRTGHLEPDEVCHHSYECASGYCGGNVCTGSILDDWECHMVCMDLFFTEVVADP